MKEIVYKPRAHFPWRTATIVTGFGAACVLATEEPLWLIITFHLWFAILSACKERE